MAEKTYLFRYCHNDPIDLTDPMGTEPPPTYSPRQTSLQKAEEDNSYNFIMGLMQRQFSSAISAGMAGYQYSSVWSGLQGQNLIMAHEGSSQAQGGVPARYVPALDKNGNQKIDDSGYRKAYQWQLVDENGHPFKGWDLTNREQLLSKSNPNAKVITSGPMRLSSQGILTDVVGLRSPPGLNDRPSHTVETFSNTVHWNGYPYPLSTVFRHDITVNQGVVTINATIDVP